MNASPLYDQAIDVMKELFKFTPMVCDRSLGAREPT